MFSINSDFKVQKLFEQKNMKNVLGSWNFGRYSSSESSNQFFLIITSASITNIFTIVVSTSIIKNGVAEQSIRTVSEMECAMILHSCVLWKNGTGSNLWHTATSYSTYIYNHIPNAEEIAPADIFTGTKFPRHELKYIHVWG